MSQSKTESLVEAITNNVVAFGYSVALNFVFMPWFGLHVTLSQSAGLTILFTIASIARQYALRRFFNSDLWRRSVGRVGRALRSLRRIVAP
jgi:hypothetical protein